MARSSLIDSEERFNYQIFKDFENGKMIYHDEFNKLSNYLCGHINADYSPNRGYYYDFYNLFLHIQIVTRWRVKKGRVNGAKLGERICYREYSDGILININEDKGHLKYCHYCR